MPDRSGDPGFGLSVAPAQGVASSPPPPPGRPPSRRPRLSEAQIVEGVLRADRAVLGRAISLVESSRPAHIASAQRVLTTLMPKTGNALRLGITGVPGVGKSTFIERLGAGLTERGRRVAVLAVDPSSGVSGGSILGDKTRMPRLAADPNAFVRPSPTAGALGGVARRTRETMLLCEAAGFDIVIVETVGVGQSETQVAEMTDCFLALMLAGAGDELQGIKRGLLELVDVVAVNKADGDNLRRARLAAGELEMALRVMARHDDSGGGPRQVRTCSARTGEGVDELWDDIERRQQALRSSGQLERRRRRQTLGWVRSMVREGVQSWADERAKSVRKACEEEVAGGRLSPAAAAERILASILGDWPRARGAGDQATQGKGSES